MKLGTQTFGCEWPLSALFLLTDSPPGNVSLLAKKRKKKSSKPKGMGRLVVVSCDR